MTRTTIYRIALIIGMAVTAYGAFTADTINGAALVFGALTFGLYRSLTSGVDKHAEA